MKTSNQFHPSFTIQSNSFMMPTQILNNFSLQQLELEKALFFFANNKLLSSYVGDFKIERITPYLNNSESSNPSSTQLEQFAANSQISNLILNQGYYLARINTDKDINNQAPKPTTYYLTRGLKGGARTLDQTKSLLDNSLTSNQKVVFISYRWSKENDPQIDNLCSILEQNGILPLRDRDSFELGDRIDEYMKLINHPAVDQVIMLIDEGYLKSRNCMNEMRLTFQNPELSKGKAIIIPLTGSLFTAYQSKKGEITKHWQEKHDQYQKEDNIKEAQLSLQIAKRVETFLDTMGMQTSEILSKRAASNFESLIIQINKLNKQNTTSINDQILPFSKDKIYVGREDEQDFIINSLNPGHITTLIGPGGIGKSALVRHTLRSMEGDLFTLFPDGVILVEFNSGISILKAISDVVMTIDPTHDGKNLYQTYQRLITSKKVLLLIDGAEDARIQKQDAYSLDDILDPIEQSRSSVIMTTRVHDDIKDLERSLVINELNKKEQRELLLKHLINYKPLAIIYKELSSKQNLNNAQNSSNVVENAVSKEISNILSYLGGLPLAIELAGSYLSRTNIPFKNFIAELEESPFAILNKDKSKVKSSDHHKGVEYLINNNIAQLETIEDKIESQISKEALLIMGYGAYSALSYQRLKSILTDLHKNLTDNLLADGALKHLQQLGLIKAEGQDKFVVVHALVYRYIQNKVELPENIKLAMINNYDNYLKESAHNKKEWSQIDQELVHIIGITKLAIKNKQYKDAVEMIDHLQSKVDSYDSYKYYLNNNGDYIEIMELLQLRLKAIKEAVKQETNQQSVNKEELTHKYQAEDIANCYILIGELEGKFANYEQALTYFKQAHDLYIKHLGSEHERVALALDNIASVYCSQGQYDQALEQFQISLRITKAKFGDDHPVVAATINGIALVYDKQGQYDQALEQYQIALRIRKAKLEDDHPVVATTIIGIALVYDKQGQYDQALEQYQIALRITKAKLGDDHPSVADTIIGIANVYDSQGQYDQALKQYKIALRITKAKFGDDHPSVADTINNIALVYDKQGQYDQALEQYQIALRIYQAKLGDDHPSVAITINNIAVVYKNQGQYDQALEQHQIALRIKKAKLGDDHPSVANTINNIALVYDNQGQYDQALEQFQIALRIKKAKLGDDHPSAATTINNIALVYNSQGQYNQALEQCQIALRIRKDKLGDDHPYVAETINNIALIYDNQGQYNQALEQYQIALRIKKDKLGDDHPSVVATINGIALIYDKQGQYDQALEQYQIALRIRKAKFGDDHPSVIDTINNIKALKVKMEKPLSSTLPTESQKVEKVTKCCTVM
jgi:tetratricopeptide (TPR) repeat protein